MKRFNKIPLILLAASSFTFMLPSYAQQNNNVLSSNPTTALNAMPSQVIMPGNNNTSQPAPDEVKKIENIVHTYLIKNPNVIMEALQVLQHQQFEQAEQAIKKTQQSASQFAAALFHNADDPVLGNPQGTITLVEFFDYQCGHCIAMAPVLDALVKANSNLRFVLKEFPIQGATSDFAARAALAANKQGKYAIFHTALLSLKQPLTQALILKTAAQVGIKVAQLQSDMNSSTTDQHLKTIMKLAQDLKLFGTPAFFIGKTSVSSSDTATGASQSIYYVPGQMDQKQLQDLLEKAAK